MQELLLAPATEAVPPVQRWQPPTVTELGQLLPQYEILRLLGQGGMGAVYQGRQRSLDRLVAIKILSNDLAVADASFAERFKNEARAMAKLSHPGIVTVHDFGETPNGLLFIVMEFIEGTDVQKMITAGKRLHTEHAMTITAHVCDALQYAHERGIIHRDIKPANVMVGYDGGVKVADFGLAKMTAGADTPGFTQSGLAMGTLHYMAPEALTAGMQVDSRTDIYALGVMLYHMLTGCVPQGMFELPSLQVAGLDPRYDRIITRAMRADRDQRYPTAADMRADLNGIVTQPVPSADTYELAQSLALRTHHVGQRPVTPVTKASGHRGWSLRPWAWAAALLLGAAAVAGSFWGRYGAAPLDSAGFEASPPAVAGPGKPETALPTPAGWTDVMAAIRLPQDALAGSWEVIAGELHCTADSPWPLCLLNINYPGGSYDLEITLTRGQGSGSGIHTSICKDGFGGVVVFDYFKTDRDIHEGKKLAGLETIRGQRLGSGPASSYALRSQWLPVGQKKTLLIQVRDVGLLVKLDQEEVIRWQGDWSDVAQGPYFSSPSSPNRPIFSVGPYRSDAVYHSIRWRQVTGDEAKSLPDKSS